MPLQQILTTDSVNVTASVTFNNPAQLDRIDFANNQITFAATSSFNLSKSDTILYIQFLLFFNNNLFINFPYVSQSVNGSFPVSSFNLFTTNLGVKKIDYVQSSNGVNVLNMNYLPIASSCAFAARPSPVTVTLQEFYMMTYVLGQYANQISVN